MSTSDDKRLITMDDLTRIVLVSDPQAHGDTIVWVETTMSTEKDTYRSALMTGLSTADDQRRLTSGTHRDSNPRFSSDGRAVAFLSNRPPMLARPDKESEKSDEKSEKSITGNEKEKTDDSANARHPDQIWLINLDGGEARQISNHINGASAFDWSPDGSQLVFVASDDVAPSDTFQAATSTGPVADERVVHDLSYRFDGRGWIDKYSHLWTVDIDSGKHVQLTSGDVNDVDPQWSPDGGTIAFVSNRRSDRKRRFGARAIHTIPATGGNIAELSPDNGSFGAPSWSPDGSRIAWLGHEDANAYTANVNVWIANANGKSCRNLTSNWDVSANDYGMSDVHASSDTRPRWNGEEELFVLASQRGETQIWRVNVRGRASKPVALTFEKRRIGGFAITTSGLAYVSGQIHLPSELFVAKPGGKSERQRTRANDQLVSELKLAEATDLEVTSHDGQSIQAWLLTPPDRKSKSSSKAPLIVQIHGGPHAMYGYDFFHEMQLMAAKGYAVLFCNPRGSQGYGESFNGTTRARWGESDMPDVIASLDHVLSAHPWLDADRLGVTGGSYGGYLTNWIIGHDDRFKAAVTQRCVSNFYSFFGTSDIGVNFGEFEFGGVPWRDQELLLKHSPISYVDNITTPLLIVHSENDLRCPIEQAEQMFVALKYLEREVGFVRIPGESHDLSRSGTPSRRRARLHHIIGWFDGHL